MIIKELWKNITRLYTFRDQNTNPKKPRKGCENNEEYTKKD